MRLAKRLLPLGGLVLALGSTACVVSPTHGRVRTATVVTTGPALVPVTQDVWVMENYQYPMFYSDGYYWRYDRGDWYRSYRLDDRPVRVRVSYVPWQVRRIERPAYYRYYQAPNGVVRRTPPGHVRGHRYR